jgi:hypothetical protein
MLPGVPWRSVTVSGLDCCENTVNEVAVQAAGTHVRIDACSLALAFGLLTE